MSQQRKHKQELMNGASEMVTAWLAAVPGSDQAEKMFMAIALDASMSPARLASVVRVLQIRQGCSQQIKELCERVIKLWCEKWKDQ